MKNNTIIIGIAGASGSGKSLISSNLLKDFGPNEVTVLREDNYYKELMNMPMAVRNQMNFDHPDALDHDTLRIHLETLQAGEKIDVPQYDYTTHSRKPGTITVAPHKIIVLDGILILTDPSLRSLLDIKIFVDTPLDICLLRRIQRDTIERGRTVTSVLEQYEKTVRPMYLQFIEPSKRYADIIIPLGGKNEIAIDIIKTKMNSLLGS
ncbi:MAG: uridine kinase [Pseudomonadales bacterium]|nr:uridine kinase [Pseudomonadales bacterium]